MGFDETLNWFYEYVFMGRGGRWHNFPDMGKGEQWYSYYYAENRLYIIRDGMTDQLYFVKAGSPREAYLEFFRRMEEARNAGSYVDEDEEV